MSPIASFFKMLMEVSKEKNEGSSFKDQEKIDKTPK